MDSITANITAPAVGFTGESIAAAAANAAREEQAARPERPVRRLSRRDSAQEASLNRQMIAKRFEEVPFKDPDNHRAYPLGPHVLTSEHKRLIGRMRMELGRITLDHLEAKRKISIAEHDKAELWAKSVSQRAEIRRLQNQNTQLTSELIEAHRNLEQMDTLFMASREKRMSRNITETIEQIQRIQPDAHPAVEEATEMLARPIVIRRNTSRHGR
jgi:hypothetical protein